MTSEPQAERVLVVGDDSRSVLTVIRSLGRAGKEVHVAPFNWNAPALHSRYVSAIHRLPRYGTVDSAEELLRLQKTFGFSLIIPCCDRGILILNRHRALFGDTRLAIPDRPAIETLFDKAATREAAIRLGIPVAPGRILNATDNAASLARHFGLPLFVKARRSYRLESLDTRGKVYRADTIDGLAQILAGIEEPDAFLVERCFDGEGVGLSVLANAGHVEHAFQHRRLHEAETGGSSLRVSEAIDPALHSAASAMAELTALTGVCMFEFRRAPTGDFVLIEANARFWGSLPLPVSVGVDFPLFLYDLLVHRRIHDQVLYPAGIRARNLLHDGYNLVRRVSEASGTARLRNARDLAAFAAHPLLTLVGSERSDTFVHDDLLPGLVEVARMLRTLADKRELTERSFEERRNADRQGRSRT